jgi:hypothetical protein
MHLGVDQGVSPAPLEIELTPIAANHMEHRRLLSEKVLDTSQDEIFCLAGFTYSQQIAEKANCYGRLAVVSDVDDGGVCPECRQGVERICRAITKQVQRSDARIEVDVMHTWNECTE